MKFLFNATAAACLATVMIAAHAAPDLSPKAATAATQAANAAFGAGRTLASTEEIENATRGFLGTLSDPQIKDAKGNVAWDVAPFAAFKGAAPATVNPSLWESAKLVSQNGLFKVSDRIYQVRNLDIDNMTLIEGKTGWIIIDPMMTTEVSQAAMALVRKHLGDKPIKAILYTHTHADHFGGARGIVDEADVKAGKVKIVAPEGFMENAIAENVLAGNVMARRAHYQFGTPLNYGPQGSAGVGLGSGLSFGTIGLVPPTDLVSKTGQEMVLDGVRVIFQLAPATEAPSEMLFYFPELKALCLAEDVNKTMHNIYTLRGAKVRDSLGWSKYINELLDLFPDADVAFGSHTWPTWGNANIHKQLVMQRDMYRFIHDQALFLANQGKKMDDISNAAFYPKALMDNMSTRGYYGSLSQNMRGVYNFYLGYFDGNPATLNRYGTAETGRRYVTELGGAAAVLEKGRKSYAAGDYRWTAEIVNHLVMAEPDNTEARALQADALEQIGYQAENGVWRSAFLTGAKELREGVKPTRLSTQGPDVLRAMTPEMVFDLLAVRLNHEKVDGMNVGIQVNFNDSGEKYALELSNSVLNNTKGRVLKAPQVTLSLSTPSFMKLTVGKVPMPDLITAGELKLEGDPKALGAVFANMETPDPLFNIVTP